jgi:hypothetical protein
MSSNCILSRLAAAELALLEPHLQPVELSVHRALEGGNRRIDLVYFIEVGFASVVADGSSKPSIEVGIIGREGMTGLAIVMGQRRAPHATYVQIAGKAQRICADKSQQYPAPGHAALRPCVPATDHVNSAGQRAEQNLGAVGALASDGA